MESPGGDSSSTRPSSVTIRTATANAPSTEAESGRSTPTGEGGTLCGDWAHASAAPKWSVCTTILRNPLAHLTFMLPFAQTRVAHGRCASRELWRYHDSGGLGRISLDAQTRYERL